MTRQEINRAIDRLKAYGKTIEDEMFNAGLEMIFDDEDYVEAWIRAMERVTYDDLDNDSKIWFIDDEDEYKAAHRRAIEDYEKRVKFADILAEELERID